MIEYSDNFLKEAKKLSKKFKYIKSKTQKDTLSDNELKIFLDKYLNDEVK